jgi:hypothetical protein
MEQLTILPVLLATSVWLVSVIPQQVMAGYNVGVGIADVTGPSAEVGFVSIPSCSVTFTVSFCAGFLCRWASFYKLYKMQ